MNIRHRSIFVIAIIGALACLISFVLSWMDSDGYIDALLFGIAMLSCISAAFKAICINQPQDSRTQISRK